jgi:KaiC/GvpD/RAD55 family RecA-like ATPase
MATTPLYPLPEVPELPAEEVPIEDLKVAAFHLLKRQLGIYSGAELAERVRKLRTSGHLVKDFLQPCSVNILVGDSGIGKSALVYQLAMAVAAGKRFLGHATQPGKVILVDYENSLWDAYRIVQQQRKHLGLDHSPTTLQIWPMNEAAPEASRAELLEQGLHENVEQAIYQFAPDLVIFDSLRSFNPAMENDNAAAVAQIKQLRSIARRHGTAILLVHHVRKHAPRTAGALEDDAPLDWLMRSAGSRALINQTDTRLAISRRKKDDDTLVMRGHIRTHGEIGPWLLARIWDEADQPLAYRRFSATPDMLENFEQEGTFLRLPEAFSFGEARLGYGKQHQATSDFLRKLIRLGLIVKAGRGQFRKSKAGVEGGFCPEPDVSLAA